jgi:hypothetical protein
MQQDNVIIYGRLKKKYISAINRQKGKQIQKKKTSRHYGHFNVIIVIVAL